jgi:hypothetical protein
MAKTIEIMRRCPTCNRAFDDDLLIVCPDDGRALAGPRETTTQGYDALAGKATWNPSQDQIAEIQQYVATATKPQHRIWPWVVVAVVILVILIGLAAIVVGRL